MISAGEAEYAIERARSARSSWGLLRFAMGWLFFFSVVGLFVPDAFGWGIAGLALSILLWLVASARMAAYGQLIMMLTEHLLFQTPEGLQSLKDEAARVRRQGGF